MRAHILLLIAGGLAVLLSCIPGGIAVHLAVNGDGRYVDATPTELVTGSRPAPGEVVWLRGERDRGRPIALPDGRIVYPTLEDRRVMVDCEVDDCVGSLLGRVEDLSIDGPLPANWPLGTERHVRVVRVGRIGDVARRASQVATAVAAGLVVLGLALCGGGFWRLRARGA